MTNQTAIEWTDTTWNPVTGCTKVSPGCDRCYAEGIAERFRGTKGFPNGFDVTLRPERLADPLKWRTPRRVFVNSMSDLFHKDVPEEFIARVWAVMAATPQHTFQVLTKRHGRMQSLLSDPGFESLVIEHWDEYREEYPDRAADRESWDWYPLENVWLGVSVEDQQRADLRIPALLQTPATVRFLSCEPLLGPIDLDGPIIDGHRPHLNYWLTGRPYWGTEETEASGLVVRPLTVAPHIDWVIVGGESGSGARPMHPDWARGLRDQCTAAGVPFFFKQWGQWRELMLPDYDGAKPIQPAHRFEDDTTMIRVGKKDAGRELDGRTWDQFPGGAR